MKLIDRQAQRDWDEHLKNLMRSVTVDHTESESERIVRKQKLEKDFEQWANYYFPAYATSEPAPFHKKAARRVINNRRWFEVRAWSRELAKTTRTMIEVLFLVLVKKEVRNTVMVSNSYDNAERLLSGYKLSLEHNQRIIHDYGTQEQQGSWTSGEFITRQGASFRALGAGQNPRGSKNEEWRVDCILIDDYDTDEECRNELRIKEKVSWIEKALLPTLSVSGNYRVIVCGNIIAPVCTVKALMKVAMHSEIVNIRDAQGRSSWVKNSEADIDQFLGMLSYATIQGEFYNNPITEGTVFQEMAYKPIRPLIEYGYLVCYTDPSFKESKRNDYKATVLVGRWRDEYHVLKAYANQTTTAAMIDWHYEVMAFVADRVPVYYLMEANFLQDIILQEFYRASMERKKTIPISGDMRSKPDKFTRIEALLEPLNRNAKLYLNLAEEHAPGMRVLREQFLSLEPGSRAHDDAPDAVEGAVFELNRRWATDQTKGVTAIPYKNKNQKRY